MAGPVRTVVITVAARPITDKYGCGQGREVLVSSASRSLLVYRLRETQKVKSTVSAC